jgi:hypothetical protein
MKKLALILLMTARSVRKRKTVLSLSNAALLAAALVLAVAAAQPAQAKPSYGQPCSSCHISPLPSPRPPGVVFDWQIVVNNGVQAPGDSRRFNSYNPPSLNVDRLVVFRARTKGGMGGQPVHGVFTRDMAELTPATRIFDRKTAVPQPNNLGSTFIEPPSFPRIDMWSDTVASRGNHQPVWRYLLEGTETRAGTTGIYTNPFGPLIAGTSNVGAVPDFDFFAVPGIDPAVKFDVFPGAPAVTGTTVVFKGNFAEGLVSRTGVYYRDLTDAPITLLDGITQLAPAGGMTSVVRIADTTTIIPGTRTTRFGSTAPPSAAKRLAVFAGFDNEANPTKGGIYRAPLTANPTLTTLVKIGGQVPGEDKGTVFNKLGEGLSFDGRFVAFWGAWGSATRKLVLQCPEEGNAARLAYCREQYPNGFATTVPINQGIFVYDTVSRTTAVVAKSPSNFSDFVYWNFSGRVPGVGEGGEDDDTGEPARWRSATFLAVSGLADKSSASLVDANFHVAFKARTGKVRDGAYVAPVDGIYLRKGPGKAPIAAVVETGMDGSLMDPEAVIDDDEDPATPPVPLPVTKMGIERDGFRGDAFAITVSMGSEEAGWAGIYLTAVPAALR